MLRSARCSSWSLRISVCARKARFIGVFGSSGAEQRGVVFHGFGVSGLGEKGAADGLDPQHRRLAPQAPVDGIRIARQLLDRDRLVERRQRCQACGHRKFEPCIWVKPTLPSMLICGVIWTPTPAVAVSAYGIIAGGEIGQARQPREARSEVGDAKTCRRVEAVEQRIVGVRFVTAGKRRPPRRIPEAGEPGAGPGDVGERQRIKKIAAAS